MKKPLGFNSEKHLRESINKILIGKNQKNLISTEKVDFIDDVILIKNIDYYYTNAIARSSKVMNECKQISKKYLFTGIEKAS